MSESLGVSFGRNARRNRKVSGSVRRSARLAAAARATIEPLESRQLLTAVIASPDPVIPWSATRAPLAAKPGHSFYVSGNDTAVPPANGQWDNASAVTPNTANDLILNQAPSDSNYAACCEAGGNSINIFTNGLTQSTPGGTPSGLPDDASAPDNVIADLNGAWHATYQLGGATPNPNGYDLSEIDLISGHQDYRVAMPAFDVSVEPVGSSTFYSLSGGQFSFTSVPDGMGGSVTLGKGSAQAAIVNSTGGSVATHIQAVRFDHLAGAGTFWREFVVTGLPSSGPITTGTPAAPSLSAANTPGSQTGVTLTLTNNANNQQGFQIERSVDGTNFTQISSIYSVDPSGTKITFTDSAPILSGTVYYRARAFNGANESGYSSPLATVQIVATNGWEAQYYMSDQANQSVYDGDQVAGVQPPQPDGTDGSTQASAPATPPTNNAVLGFERLETTPINEVGLNDSNPPPGAPAGFNTIEPAGPGHDFSARWTGYITAPATGYYTLQPNSDDGVAVTVFDTTHLTAGKPTPVTLQKDNIFVPRGIQGTADQDPVVDSTGAPVQWIAGQKYLVQMDYNNFGGGWGAQLSYAAASTFGATTFDVLPSQIVPVSVVSAPIPTFATIDAAHPNGLAKDASFYTLAAVPGNGSVQLNFNNIDATSYNIYRSTSPFTSLAPPAGGAGKIANITANSGGLITYVDSPANNGITYYYLVTGMNSSGEGNGITASASPATSLTAPTGLTATATPNSVTGVTLSFTSAGNEQSYLIERSSDGTNFSPLATISSTAPAGTTVTYQDNTINANGGTFTYRVTAKNFSIQSAPSTPATITVAMAPPLNFEPDFSHGNPTTLLQFNSNGAGTPAFAPTITASTDTPPNALRLLDNQGSEAESAFSKTQYGVATFDTTFDFQWGDSIAADGFTFTLQNNSPTALGGAGGALGFGGIPKSVAVFFNLYNGVSQTGLITDGGAQANPQDLTMQNGAPTNIDFHNLATDTYEAHLTYDGTTLHETLTDLTEKAAGTTAVFTHDYPIDVPGTLGSNTGYVGFTAGTGGATTSLYMLNWMYNGPISSAAAHLVSTGFGDGSALSGTQRSEVRDIKLTFDHAVTLGAGAVTLTSYAGNDTTGTFADGSAALGTATTSDGGLTWIVPVLANTAFTDATGSLKDGIYKVTIDPSKVTGANLAGNGLSTTFHRLYGDIDGNKTVNSADYFKFKAAFGSSTGQANFNADFDFDGNGKINSSDYFKFKANFGKKFTY